MTVPWAQKPEEAERIARERMKALVAVMEDHPPTLTVTTTEHRVQAKLSTGWADASAPLPDIADARRIMRNASEATVANSLRIVERTVTTVTRIVE